ncbi:MAG: ABC transporter permease [Clostridia bacterium]|nr:ABC transporter permease [Clostridia bacterium]
MRKRNKPSGNAAKVLRKLLKRKTALIGMVIYLVMIFLAIFGNLLYGQDPFAINISEALSAPSLQHWMGTDDMGRDLFSRVIYGARISLSVSIASVAVALVLGSIIGVAAGYIGGKIDAALSMVIETICAFPTILVGLTLAAILGSGIPNIVLAIGIANTPAFARLLRSMTLSIREREYIESAVTIGLRRGEIMARHVFPNLTSVVIVQTTMAAASAILSEASLSFMGLGVQAPAASWGTMLRTGYDYMSLAPWMSIFPGIAIMLTVLGLNYFGDGLRDALDVKIRTD